MVWILLHVLPRDNEIVEGGKKEFSFNGQIHLVVHFACIIIGFA
jgi:hypothetical protein